MGIKDNFSQAVKELWKKDGQDKKDDKQQSQPSELDRYLRGDNGGQGNTVLYEDDFSESGVPLETPYYRNPEKTGTNAQTQNASQTQTNQPSQAADPMQRAQQPQTQQPQQNQNVRQSFADESEDSGADRAPYNQNVQNARQNMGAAPQGGADNYGGGYGDRDSYGGGQSSSYGNQGGYGGNQGGYGNRGNFGGSYGGGLGGNPPAGAPAPDRNETEETTVISKNTMIDGNIRSLANMHIDGNVKGNVETTRNIEMSGKVIGDVTCNNAGMVSAAMQGNISLKGRMRMDRDTILIGDLSSQYADINGRVRGKLDIVGKAELKRDAVVFGDINASTIAVTDGAIIQGYVNTTFLSKEDSRNVFPDAISIDSKEVKS